MENKSIWDIISKLTGANGANENQNQSSVNTNGNAEATPPLEATNKQSGVQGSFSKSYNPFITEYFDRPQISSKKAEKPTRTTIDLKNSKNVNRNATYDSSPSIVELINKHNYYSKKIRDKKE